MGKPVLAFESGHRATLGRRPSVVIRSHSRNYRLYLPSRRWQLFWSPWHGYRVEAWAKLVAGRVVDFGYYTY